MKLIIVGLIAAISISMVSYFATSSDATTGSSGTIVGRVFEPDAVNYKQTQLTVLPYNSADAYGVYVTAECFDVVRNGNQWPNSIAACQ